MATARKMVLCANQDNKKSITAGYASIKVDIFCQISFQSSSDSLTAENRLRH